MYRYIKVINTSTGQCGFVVECDGVFLPVIAGGALPNKVDSATPVGTDAPSTIDDQLRALKLFIEDLFAIPTNTNISAAVMTVVAAGLSRLNFTDAAASPTAAGQFQRNGANLEYYNTAARIVYIQAGTDIAVADGGTGLSSGTSGGILGYTGATTLASSVALTANAIVVGGGAGATPTPLASLGTTTTLLHGNAAGAPTFSAVSLTADVSGILPTANGGTGIAFFTAAGPTIARVYTFPDAATTVLTTNAAVTVGQGGTGATTFTDAGVLLGNGTGAVQVTTAGTAGQVLTSNGAGVDPTFQVGTTTSALRNVGFTATVAVNALTFTLTAEDSTTLSSTNKASIDFRNATITTGQHNSVDVTSAITLVISSGSTLGATSGVATRYYLGAINNAGAAELCAWNSRVGTDAAGLDLFGVNESEVVTTTAEGGAGGADTAGVVYSTTARTSVPVRVLGYIDISEATAGTYATAPTRLTVMGPGIPRTGDIIQTARIFDKTAATGTNVVPDDDTPPLQATPDGTLFLSQAITPTNAINLLHIHSTIYMAFSAGTRVGMPLYQDSTSQALACTRHYMAAADGCDDLVLDFWMVAGTTSSTTFKIHAGAQTAGTWTLNGEGGARKYGGVLASTLSIEEVCA